MEYLRLTVQLRDERNRVRLQERHDVALDQVSQKAGDVAGKMATYYLKAKRAVASEGETE